MEFKLIDLAVSVTKLASYLSIHQTYYISYIFILYNSIYMDHIFILYLTYIYIWNPEQFCTCGVLSHPPLKTPVGVHSQYCLRFLVAHQGFEVLELLLDKGLLLEMFVDEILLAALATQMPATVSHTSSQ